MFEIIGQRIRKYRLKKNLTQHELAKRVNITVQHVGKIERAQTKTSLEMLEKICLALDISIEQLFINYEIMDLVKNKQILLSFIEMLEDQPTEVLEELLKINSITIESFRHFLSKK